MNCNAFEGSWNLLKTPYISWVLYFTPAVPNMKSFHSPGFLLIIFNIMEMVTGGCVTHKGGMGLELPNLSS